MSAKVDFDWDRRFPEIRKLIRRGLTIKEIMEEMEFPGGRTQFRNGLAERGVRVPRPSAHLGTSTLTLSRGPSKGKSATP